MGKKQYLDEEGLEVLIQYITNNYVNKNNVVKIPVNNFLATTPFSEGQLKLIIDSYNKGKVILIKDSCTNWILPTIMVTDQSTDYGNSKAVKISFLYGNRIHEISQSVTI